MNSAFPRSCRSLSVQPNDFDRTQTSTLEALAAALARVRWHRGRGNHLQIAARSSRWDAQHVSLSFASRNSEPRARHIEVLNHGFCNVPAEARAHARAGALRSPHHHGRAGDGAPAALVSGQAAVLLFAAAHPASRSTSGRSSDSSLPDDKILNPRDAGATRPTSSTRVSRDASTLSPTSSGRERVLAGTTAVSVPRRLRSRGARTSAYLKLRSLVRGALVLATSSGA